MAKFEKDINPIDDVMGIVARGQEWDLTKQEGKLHIVRQAAEPAEPDNLVDSTRLAAATQMLRLERKHRLKAERKLRLLHLKAAGICMIPLLSMTALSHRGLINKWVALVTVAVICGYQIWAIWNAPAPKYKGGRRHA